MRETMFHVHTKQQINYKKHFSVFVFRFEMGKQIAQNLMVAIIWRVLNSETLVRFGLKKRYCRVGTCSHVGGLQHILLILWSVLTKPSVFALLPSYLNSLLKTNTAENYCLAHISTVKAAELRQMVVGEQHLSLNKMIAYWRTIVLWHVKSLMAFP
jgi:hypothetical protein